MLSLQVYSRTESEPAMRGCPAKCGSVQKIKSLEVVKPRRLPVYIEPSTPLNTPSAFSLCGLCIFSISCRFSSAKDGRAVPFLCSSPTSYLRRTFRLPRGQMTNARIRP